MVVLHQGMLAHFSCNQRMGILFLAAVALQGLMLAWLAWGVYYPRSDYGYREAYKISTLDGQSPFSRHRIIALAVWMAVVSLVAAVCMASRTETLLSMDDRFITETSCIGPFAQEYKLDRPLALVEHRTEREWLPRRKGPDHYLAILQPGKPRTLFIDLKGRRNAPELVALAPRAMQDYADALRNLAEMKPLSQVTPVPAPRSAP